MNKVKEAGFNKSHVYVFKHSVQEQILHMIWAGLAITGPASSTRITMGKILLLWYKWESFCYVSKGSQRVEDDSDKLTVTLPQLEQFVILTNPPGSFPLHPVLACWSWRRAPVWFGSSRCSPWTASCPTSCPATACSFCSPALPARLTLRSSLSEPSPIFPMNLVEVSTELMSIPSPIILTDL